MDVQIAYSGSTANARDDMSDIDNLLAHLRDDPPRVDLSMLDQPVMAGLARRRDAQEVRRGLVLACAIAFFVGAGATLVPGSPAAAEPLLGMPKAAPSHLLAD